MQGNINVKSYKVIIFAIHLPNYEKKQLDLSKQDWKIDLKI